MEQTNSSSPRYIKVKGEDTVEISMTSIIMIKEIIRIGIDQIAEIGEFNLVVEFNMDIIIEVEQGMDKVMNDTYDNFSFTTSLEEVRSKHLHL